MFSAGERATEITIGILSLILFGLSQVSSEKMMTFFDVIFQYLDNYFETTMDDK